MQNLVGRRVEWRRAAGKPVSVAMWSDAVPTEQDIGQRMLEIVRIDTLWRHSLTTEEREALRRMAERDLAPQIIQAGTIRGVLENDRGFLIEDPSDGSLAPIPFSAIKLLPESP